MKKSKSSEHGDRLSELPDSLILSILSFLPMRDVVRTTLLSKRRKDLWTTVPCLIFDGHTNSFDPYLQRRTPNPLKKCSDKFRNFVNRAMLLRKGIKILKFDLDFIFHQSCTSDLDTWLRAATENAVEELRVDLRNPDKDVDPLIESEYFAPQCLYSCSSIRKLSLVFCNLKIDGEVHWNQLKSLTINGVRLSEHVTNQLLSGAPLLVVLNLGLVESSENLNIRSSSLKALKIEKDVDIDVINVDAGLRTTLRMWAPNVETLEISGDSYIKYLLMDISSLTSATVGFFLPDYNENGSFSAYKLLEGMLGQVLQSVRQVEKVALSDCCIQVLGDMKKKDMIAPISSAKLLKLYAHDVNETAGLLMTFSKLTMLDLTHSLLGRNDEFHYFEILCCIKEPSFDKCDAETSLESKANFPKSYLLHLRTVEITWIERDNSIFPFVEFLLKYAGKAGVSCKRNLVACTNGVFVFGSKKTVEYAEILPKCRGDCVQRLILPNYVCIYFSK